MTSIAVPLSKLHLSPLNVRQIADGDPAADTTGMQASLLTHGLISPLVAHHMAKPKGHFGVLAGGRRLRAFKALAERKLIPADYPIEIVVRDEDAITATELSVIENTERHALSATQEFLAFAKLAEAGADEDAIAVRFGVTKLHVRQRMRLGQLHPTILAALDAATVSLDAAKAYAATVDQDLQLRVFEEQAKGWNGHQAHSIRHAINRAGSAYDTEMMLKFVGIDAYVGAGGNLEEDLFTGKHRVLQPGTLSELYYAKLEDEKGALAATLPAGVEIVTSRDAIGAYVQAEPTLTAEQIERRAAIDARAVVIDERLEAIADWDTPGDSIEMRPVAIEGASQQEVDQLLEENKALEAESESILAAAPIRLPEGPVVALAQVDDGGLRVVNYYRPSGWVDATSSTSGAASSGWSESAAIVKPEGIENPGGGRALGVAKETFGLSQDAVEVMRSHRRAILRGMMVTRDTTGAMRNAGDFLTFTLLRSTLQEHGLGRVSAAELGVAPGAYGTTNNRIVANLHEEVGTQPGQIAWKAAIDDLRGAEWMVEKDLQVAFAIFTEMPGEERDHAQAVAAGVVLERSLRSPGFAIPLHDQLAFSLGDESDEDIRRLWTPDMPFFERMSKKWRLAAVAEVSPNAAKQISKLPTAEISAACARFFRAGKDDQAEFGMLPGTVTFAQRWLPEYLRFSEEPRGWRLTDGANEVEGLAA